MEQLPKIVGQRLRAMATMGAHPDASLLTAFAEKSLTGHERGQVLEHLAHCGDCREVVSLALPDLVGGQAIFPKPARPSWLSWPTLRWAAACVVVVGAVVTDRYVQHEKVATFSPVKQTESIALALKTSGADRENDRLAAKLEPPPAAESRRDRDVAPRARRAPAPAQAAGAMSAPSSAMKNAPNALSLYDSPRPQAAQVPSAPESVEVAAPPLSSVQGAGVQAKNDASADESSNNVVPRATNETVEVTAEAPLLETTEAAPGKAKDAKKSLDKELQAQTGSNMVTARSGAADQPSLQGRNYTSLVALTPPVRWSLSPKGAVERSLDAGKTWQGVPVAAHVIFRAVSALGPEIWVGGTDGSLYHSSDNGQTWTPVKPAVGGTPLTADITSLQFIDVQHGKLTTADHQTWMTKDAGKSWQKQ